MSGVEKKENIIVYNAYENNLKNINIKIPTGKFTCFTGPSGCGKSSLVYDTIYAESQRNFLESLSGNMYGHKLMDKPKVGAIENLKPALNISQTYYNVNPRSTVGTVTDISYYIRSLFVIASSLYYNKQVDINYFSANNPTSCCKKCKGLGEEYVISEEAIIPNLSKSLAKGGILYYKGTKTSMEFKLLAAICDHYNININKGVSDLTEQEKYNLLYRTEPIELSISFKTPKGRYKRKTIYSKGVIPELENMLDDIDTPSTFLSISKFLKKGRCSSCNGNKLKPEILNIKFGGLNIAEVENMPLSDLANWLILVRKEYEKDDFIHIIHLIDDIFNRVKNLIHLELGYLTISRSIPSLSGGEIQRVRLSTQLTCSLTGLIYILDEPCKGLHYRNIDSIIKATNELVIKGNTVIAIEHDKQFISSAEKIIELGPVGGPNGGYIVSEHKPKKNNKRKIIYKEVVTPEKYIYIKNIKYHNLKNIDVKLPVGKIIGISGVSGSGKSSLAAVILEAFSCNNSERFSTIINKDLIKKVLHVSQKPIGKTPRSTVVSYLEIYDNIRKLFASTKRATYLGISASDFSMNVEGGRCETCQGTGKKRIELSFMPDSYIECPECHGKRFNDNVLSVKYNELNIIDVLNKPVNEIVSKFADDIGINSILNCLIEIGMGYVSLGQMSMTLSGGEAQRIKLAKCLGSKSFGNNLYILDEPTTGLNEKDIELLANILLKLQNNNETIIIIEHNIEFIAKISDYLIDLGCTAGDKGGTTVIQDIPCNVVKNNKSSWFGLDDYLF